MEKFERLLKLAASAVALVVPCILLSGFSYHIGYIFTFGLSHELINKDMSDVLVESWYIGVLGAEWLLTKWPFFLGFFVFLVVSGLAAFLFARHAKENSKDWLFKALSKENQGKKIFGITQWHWCQLGGMANELFSWLAYPILIVSIALVLVGFSYQRGQYDAEKQMQIYTKSGCQNEEKVGSCTYLLDTSKNNQVIAKGILISANDKKVALYNSKVEVWILLDSYLIRKDK
ncbi:hypothetical protein MAMP_02301 [Methylophaga aminisulfidivorans MP]|uniref:Uncharacterized protein n=1 Tax=Methylophaga aminisulfidivorans MP TaxID=1026882 RepID=F5SXS7_9GAMM|nr:hypothetical protein [Methylophaga aminisulfidivorans]EGL55307.1 hypothetical protein MAMP_02301 [Methylophaga aminisulfidivorans MP]